ncbi:MAG TPA: sulfatase-like hydrolase/transferase, partial [Parafilimonas sp.]|nr:sulfatase-like hydrolase/transferase [Parafilimonas sp.]
MKKYVFFLLPLIFFGGCKNITRPFNSNLAADSKDVNAARSAHPNIILIVGDDIGYEVLSCNGGQSYQTPFLDDIAANGVRYTECHACPLCSPSRVSLLTGKYNFRNYTAWGYLDPASNKTIGNMLQDQGYATCYAGKWQLSGYDPSIHALGWQKYSVWDPGDPLIAGSRYKNPHIYQDGNFLPDTATVNKYGEDMFVDYISSFMDTATKPYFIYYAMTLAHAPFSPTPDDAEFA